MINALVGLKHEGHKLLASPQVHWLDDCWGWERQFLVRPALHVRRKLEHLRLAQEVVLLCQQIPMRERSKEWWFVVVVMVG